MTTGTNARVAAKHVTVAKTRPAFGQAREFLMFVKTYPLPSTKYGETVCCAGIATDTGEWARIYPVNFRDLEAYRQFAKWQFVRARYTRPKHDQRPESFRVHQDSIELGRSIPAGLKGWAERLLWIRPLIEPSMEELERKGVRSGQSLGIIRPQKVERLIMRPADPWDGSRSRDFAQLSLDLTGSAKPKGDLEPIPYDFVYQFRCADAGCRGHEMKIFDWEIGQSYRRWRRRYGEKGWEAKLRQKWEIELPSRDLHLVLGTHHRFGTWLIVGVFAVPYPKVIEPKPRSGSQSFGEQLSMASLFVDLETQ